MLATSRAPECRQYLYIGPSTWQTTPRPDPAEDFASPETLLKGVVAVTEPEKKLAQAIDDSEAEDQAGEGFQARIQTSQEKGQLSQTTSMRADPPKSIGTKGKMGRPPLRRAIELVKAKRLAEGAYREGLLNSFRNTKEAKRRAVVSILESAGLKPFHVDPERIS